MRKDHRQLKKHFHIAWLLVIIVLGYLIGGLLCWGHTASDSISILCVTTEIILALCAIVAGISYGVQENKFWT